MENMVEVEYEQTGKSKSTNELGMREMQARAYEARNEQYLLLKSPPASGKSRALMFLALDKLYHQDMEKVIVAVPELSIGSSFKKTDLTKFGFSVDWEPEDEFNLCSTSSGSKSKVDQFIKFMDSDAKILICSHSTLRFAFEHIKEEKFNKTVLAIDEFHHVSADKEANQLGMLLHSIMQNSYAHIIAMTGSYFRGDSVSILEPQDEARFKKITYNYYEQLNGYEHLKSLGIGYHFYQGKYCDKENFKTKSPIMEVLDTDKKTILHIPSVNSAESTKDKYAEVGTILSQIGEFLNQDPETGVISVKRKQDGKILKVADLVEENERDKIKNYLMNMDSKDDIDLIIALGMAKEGFDWPWCEHALTVGYRGSLTEIIQIIGRATRDSNNKTHAQFTNLIANPEATQDDVNLSVNNMLKAITCSLLMEQVLAPSFKFKTRFSDDDSKNDPGDIKVRGFKAPSTQRVKDILESDLNDLKAKILQDDTMLKAMPGNLEPKVINKVLIPKIIKEIYPDLSKEEVEEVRQTVVLDTVVKNGEIVKQDGKEFIKMANKFVNIDEINIDLIDTINPFQRAFEILSKSVTASVLKTIKDTINAGRIEMTPEEAVILAPKIKEFKAVKGLDPSLQSIDPKEMRLAEALIWIRNYKLNSKKA